MAKLKIDMQLVKTTLLALATLLGARATPTAAAPILTRNISVGDSRAPCLAVGNGRGIPKAEVATEWLIAS